MSMSEDLLLLVSSWWEPGTKGSLDIGDLSVMLTFVLTLCGAIFGVMRWWSKRLRGMIKEEIGVATEPIHPNSNGGLSLADVARRTERLEEALGGMREEQQEMKDLLLRVLAHSMDGRSRRGRDDDDRR
jgi:hypothetical protein